MNLEHLGGGGDVMIMIDSSASLRPAHHNQGHATQRSGDKVRVPRM